MIAREWERLSPDARAQLLASFDELGSRIKSARPDVLVVISPDHWVNFFINNLPSVCIGIGEEHDGPPEPFMKAVFPHSTLRGNTGLASHILQSALEGGFEQQRCNPGPLAHRSIAFDGQRRARGAQLGDRARRGQRPRL
jgi:aromatic ring-opening dioxygenase catalytic subunit (LigB family)